MTDIHCEMKKTSLIILSSLHIMHLHYLHITLTAAQLDEALPPPRANRGVRITASSTIDFLHAYPLKIHTHCLGKCP